MPLNRADKEQIDAYIHSGQIHLARRMLQESDDPKAAKVLEKLDARYPAPSNGAFTASVTPSDPVSLKSAPVFASPTLTDLAPDLPRDEMSDVRLAIKERRYDDARALLVLSDHPDADKMLERLSHLGGSEKLKREVVDTERDLSAKLQITIFLLFFLTLPGLVALSIFLPEAKRYPHAPGAGGLLLLNRIVRFILYGLLAAVVFMLVMLFISYLTRPTLRY